MRFFVVILLLLCFFKAGVSAKGANRQIFTLVVESESVVPEKILSFSGSDIELNWIFKESGEGSSRYDIDVFRVLASTVAPVEKNVAIAEPTSVGTSGTSVTGYLLKLPESDAEQSYLVKLWKTEKGTRSAIHLTSLRLFPRNAIASLFDGQKAGVFKSESIWGKELLFNLGIDLPTVSEYSPADMDVVIHTVESEAEAVELLTLEEHAKVVVVVVKVSLVTPKIVSTIYSKEGARLLVVDSSLLQEGKDSGGFYSLLKEVLDP